MFQPLHYDVYDLCRNKVYYYYYIIYKFLVSTNCYHEKVFITKIHKCNRSNILTVFEMLISHEMSQRLSYFIGINVMTKLSKTNALLLNSCCFE